MRSEATKSFCFIPYVTSFTIFASRYFLIYLRFFSLTLTTKVSTTLKLNFLTFFWYIYHAWTDIKTQ